jgi:hypothetical protein
VITRRFKTGISRAAEDVLEVLDDHELEMYVELTERIARMSRADSTESARRATA